LPSRYCIGSSTLDEEHGVVDDQIERSHPEARTMAQTKLTNFAERTIRSVERRWLEIEESIRRAAATVPTPLAVFVVLGSIFLAFAQLIRPK
jgi:hypothetical protein